MKYPRAHQAHRTVCAKAVEGTRIVRTALILLWVPYFAFSQAYEQPDAAKIKLKLKKLNVLGSVLYVAAHPDDENTRVITSLANDDLYSVGYLSMTRGDGGQNLVGQELRDQLGVIRTQELLSARRIDGGQQFFTRANDFGFSKSAEETMRLWGKEEILSDVVKVYRHFQPDVIITRFPPDARAGHGHHTTSAILAQEAFDLSANKDAFPEHLKRYGTWKPTRLFTNTGRWWNNTINENTPGITTLNVGGYSPLLGESFTEIAAKSRSQHKSQGFGSREVRGEQKEFLEFVKGEPASGKLFDGINTSWTRLEGGNAVQPLVEKAIQTYDPEKPHELVPVLLEIRSKIKELEQGIWRERKLAEVERLIADCLGLYIDVTTDHYWNAPGYKTTIQFELINRSPAEISLQRIVSGQISLDTTARVDLKNNLPVVLKTVKMLDPKSAYSGPFWLEKPHDVGRFVVKDLEQIGKPANDPAVMVTFGLMIGKETIEISRPLMYKWTDPVKGELNRPFEIVPPVFINISEQVYIFSDTQSKEVTVQLKSTVKEIVKGDLKLQLPAGWKAEPSSIPFTLSAMGEEQKKTFKVLPSKKEMTAVLKAEIAVNGNIYSQSLKLIEYDHIPAQTLMPPAEAKVVRIEMRREGQLAGYIKGAGDDIPACLRNMGYDVWEMKEEEVTLSNLQKADVVVLGIRSLNTTPRVAFMMEHLLEYVKGGGVLVVQYNTNGGLDMKKFSPYPLTLSRDRVTDEDAEVRILKPDHPVLNYPNKITPEDFTGWVQERGLYFPGTWANEFDAVLSMNDKGEEPRNGSLLVAKYGEGYYVYTGLSFFRELPEGVGGAYKLFANILSLGNLKGDVK